MVLEFLCMEGGKDCLHFRSWEALLVRASLLLAQVWGQRGQEISNITQVVSKQGPAARPAFSPLNCTGLENDSLKAAPTIYSNKFINVPSLSAPSHKVPDQQHIFLGCLWNQGLGTNCVEFNPILPQAGMCVC